MLAFSKLRRYNMGKTRRFAAVSMMNRNDSIDQHVVNPVHFAVGLLVLTLAGCLGALAVRLLFF